MPDPDAHTIGGRGVLRLVLEQLFEDLPELARQCGQLLSDDASFLILNAYAARISGASLSGLLAQELAGRGGTIDWGELTLVEQRGGEQQGERQVGLSFFARWAS